MRNRGRDRRDGGVVKGGLAGIVVAGIGLAAEAYQHNKAKKQQAEERSQSNSPLPEARQSSQSPLPFTRPDQAGADMSARTSGYATPARQSSARSIPTPDEAPPPYSANEEYQARDEKRDLPSSPEDDFEKAPIDRDQDEAAWELDEAVEEIRAMGDDEAGHRQRAVIPKGVAKDPAQISVLVNAFVAAYPPLAAEERMPLRFPVIIPQRRPNNRDRGFVRAYAPIMAESGIDQAQWLRFLDFYDESLKYSHAITVVQIAGGVIGLVPSAACMAASAAIGIGAKIAGQAQSRQRSNDFVTRMNEQYFIPMGMVCLILKYKPESDTGSFSMQQSIGNATGPVHRNFHSAHGSTNDVEFPVAAPLIFPEIDQAAGLGAESNEDGGEGGEKKKKKLNRLQRSGRFIADYSDRRARAKFAMENPDSELGRAMMQGTKFQSSLADPSRFNLDKSSRGRSGGPGGGGGLIGGAIRMGVQLASQRGGQPPSAQGYAGQSSSYQNYGGQPSSSYDNFGNQHAPYGSYSNQPARHGSYGNPPAPYGGYGGEASSSRAGFSGRQRMGGLGGGGGLLGGVKKILKGHVVYMMVVPLPDMAEIERVASAPPPGVTLVDMETSYGRA